MPSGPGLQRSWLELEGGGEQTPFPSFPGFSLMGKLGQAPWAQILDPHTRAGEVPSAGSPDSFPVHKDALLCQSWLVVLSGMATLPIPPGLDNLLAGVCVAELQVVQTRFGSNPSWASSQEPPDHSPDQNWLLSESRES